MRNVPDKSCGEIKTQFMFSNLCFFEYHALPVR